MEEFRDLPIGTVFALKNSPHDSRGHWVIVEEPPSWGYNRDAGYPVSQVNGNPKYVSFMAFDLFRAYTILEQPAKGVDGWYP